GTAPLVVDPEGRARVRSGLRLPDGCVVFMVFGKVTAEKRMGPVLAAFSTLIAAGGEAALVIAGDATDDRGVQDAVHAAMQSDAVADRIRMVGYVPDESIADHLAAADVCLCLRWPTAQETSASWLQCLAAARPTVITDLAHLVDVPAIDPRSWKRTHP